MLRIAVVAVSLGLFSSAANAKDFWQRDGVALMPGTATWSAWGNNYAVKGIVSDSKGIRVAVKSFATVCIEGNGTLQSDRASQEFYDGPLYKTDFVKSPTVVRNGGTAADRVFETLCDAVLPDILAYERSLTDEQRARRQQVVNQGLSLEAAFRAQQAARPAAAPTGSTGPSEIKCEDVVGSPNNARRCTATTK